MAGIDSYTKLLIHFNGTDGQTTYTTEDSSARTVSFVGTAQLDTAQKQFGTASLLLDGTNDYISIPDSADWSFGSDDFTIDFWIRFNSLANGTRYCFWAQSSADPDAYMYMTVYYLDAGSYMEYVAYDDDAVAQIDAGIATLTNFSTNTWYHLAWVRSSNSILAFKGGVLQGTDSTGIGTQPEYTSAVTIGVDRTGGYDVDGWIDEFRVSKGIARWTTTFTPPTAEYSLDSGGIMTPRTGYWGDL